jgi:SRSO17 transposase
VEHCQSGVLRAYASAWGLVLLDRTLYLPKAWTQERKRCPLAGSPQPRAFATKPALARRMLERASQAGGPATGVTGDSVEGDDRRLRLGLEAQECASVLAVSGKEYGWLGWRQRQGKIIRAACPEEGWTRPSAGAGAPGPRWADWYWRPLAEPMPPAWRRGRLVRRHGKAPTERVADVVCAPQATTLADTVHGAGIRGTIESSVAAAQGGVGWDPYAVRGWTAG